MRKARLARLLALEGPLTADALAQRLEVSTRTVLRDIDALRADGMRITSQRGVGGGFRLAPGQLPVPVQLAEDEVVALWITTELALRAGVFPFVAAARSTARKAIASLTPRRRREVRRFLARVFVGPAASAGVQASLREVPPSVLVRLERAFSERRCLHVRYVDRLGETSSRVVEVHGVLIQAPIWYALCFDHLREAPRMLRVDRIRAPRVQPEVFRSTEGAVFNALLQPYWSLQELAIGAR